VKTYLINLDRHPERLALILPRLAGLDHERIAAVDGSQLSGPTVREHGSAFLEENLTRFERACIESHRIAWEKLLLSGDQTCCVLEDDVELSRDFADYVRRPEFNSGEYPLIKIERGTRDSIDLGKRFLAADGREVRSLMSSHLGSAGYFINRVHAAALLERTKSPSHPVDWILFHPSLNAPDSVLQLLPALCQQHSISGKALSHPSLASSIQYWGKKPKKTLSMRIRREVEGVLQRIGRWPPISRSVRMLSTLQPDRLRSAVEFR
jgi:GR25 family glycosyltransferase involved in LPS biosynthesis